MIARCLSKEGKFVLNMSVVVVHPVLRLPVWKDGNTSIAQWVDKVEMEYADYYKGIKDGMPTYQAR